MPLRFRIRAQPTLGYGAPGGIDRTILVEPVAGQIRLGRKAGLEIELPFPAMSGLHARIVPQGAGWTIADLDSANGTWVDGRRLAPRTPHTLAAGEVVRLGGVELTFEAPGQPGSATAAPDGNATIARRLVSDLFRAAAGVDVARIIVDSGPTSGHTVALAIPDRPYRVGRAGHCEIAVAHDNDVSREHAAFTRGWGGVVVRDLGSKNGVLVAGEKIAGERVVRDGEALLIGGITMHLEDPEDRYLRRMQEEVVVPATPPVALDAETAPAPAPAPPPKMVVAAPPRWGFSSSTLIAVAAALVLLGAAALALWLLASP